jgi:pimeloyl-ACP methyl ester carboxylesterase
MIDGGGVVRGRVRGDGVELAFGRWAGAGSPIVGLPGLMASHLNFIGIAERLAGRRGLVAFDLRGRGDSDKPAGPYGMAQHARDVAAAMRALDLPRAVVIGHSMGAYVAAALAADAPELVSGVVLLDGGYVPPLPGGAPIEPVLATLIEPLVARLRDRYASREENRAFWRTVPLFEERDFSAWLDAYIDYDLGGEPPQLVPKGYEPGIRIDFFDLGRVELVEERLRKIRVPVLIIRAPHGAMRNHPPVVPDAVVQAIRNCAPQTEDVLVEGTTHYTIALAEPGASRVAELLLAFARRCDGR